MSVATAKMGGSIKGRMPRERSEVDTSTYSGRVAARIRAAIDSRDVPIKAILDALEAAGHEVSERTLFAYLNNTRTLHPDLYPAVAKALKVKLVDLLPPK